MTALFIGEVELDDENRHHYENVFLPQANKELAGSGTKHIAGGFNNAVSLVGMPPKNRYVVIQFALQNWWQGPAGAFVRECLKKYGNAGWRLIAANGVQE
jgi:hypothetical protein